MIEQDNRSNDNNKAADEAYSLMAKLLKTIDNFFIQANAEDEVICEADTLELIEIIKEELIKNIPKKYIVAENL